MKQPKYKQEAFKPETELEMDHYESARDYFEEFGTSQEIVDKSKEFFGRYDEIKDEVLKSMETDGGYSETYVEDAKKFNAERALEIIDQAHLDHTSQPKTETDESSKPQPWSTTKS